MSLRDIDVKPEYRSLADDVVIDFYIPVLKQSVLYQRAVGFFSSTALIEISSGICGLLQNGGKIQLIASPRLSQEDIDAINDGFERKNRIIENALLRELDSPSNQFEEKRLNLLSNLVASGALEIKIAILESNNTIGMFHEKMGLMHDCFKNIIAFTGSMNESKNAFSMNYESIDVYVSWGVDADRANSKLRSFEAMWYNKEPNIQVLNFPNVTKQIVEKYQKNYLVDDGLDQDQYPSTMKEEEQNLGPRLPSFIKLREYQKEAVENWAKNLYQGIFDMATGTGKTFTALAAVVNLFQASRNQLAVIIICPFQHLVEQWKGDIEVFGMKPIVAYSASKQRNWRQRLKTSATSFTLGVQEHFCLVTTNSTFSSDFVQEIIGGMSGNIVLIVDEAHNFGAEHMSKTLLPHIPYRLALSATIDRHGDDEGTQKLYEYFGKKCIEYSLKDAIDNDMLTPYFYYPVVVTLNENELDQYLELTSQISKSSHVDKSGKSVISEYTKILLIKRARIVAGAEQKIERLREIIEKYQNDSHMLIYCGATTMRDIDYKENKTLVDEARQIDIVADLLGNELGMRVTKFSSEESSSEREQIKEDFAEGSHLQALVAIRCLDEGVNIPSIKTAFILASSTNPKEYIQRRGRVLRKFPGKTHANIYDFITLPVQIDDISSLSYEVLKNVRSLAIREITRIKDFAAIAENPYYSDSLISDVENAFDITNKEEEENLNEY